MPLVFSTVVDRENANKSLNHAEQENQDEDSFAVKLATTDEAIAYAEQLTKQGNLDGDSFSTIPPPADEHISSAEKFVRVASLYIGLGKGNTRLNHICQAMKEELIINIDQLEFIDSVQWKMMGAPIGLVATLRHRLASAQNLKEENTNLENQGSHSQSQSQSAVSHNASTFQQSRSEVPRDDVDIETSNVELATDQDVWTIQNKGSKQENISRYTIFKKMTSALCKVTKPLDWGYPALHRQFFKRAYLYTMSAAELKQTVINASELWFVALTLIFAIIVALWELFPGFENDNKFGKIEVAYNCLAFLGSSICVLTLAINAITFAVSTSVHESNFKRYYIFILNAGLPMDVGMIIAFFILQALLVLLLHAKNHISLTANNMSDNVDYMTISMFVIYMLFWIPTYFHLNFLSRLAFHCRLLEKKSRGHSTTAEKDITFPDSFMDYELEECNSALKNMVIETDEALDSYYQYHRDKSCDPSKRDSMKRQLGTRRLLFTTAHVPSIGI